MPPNSEVDHPEHYNQGEIECIVALESALSLSEFIGFCKGNAMKYLWRAGLKDGRPIQDMEKAAWYLDKLIGKLKTDRATRPKPEPVQKSSEPTPHCAECGTLRGDRHFPKCSLASNCVKCGEDLKNHYPWCPGRTE